MCSIFGAVSLGGTAVHIDKELLATAQLRGRDSWGVVTSEGLSLKCTDDDLSSFPAEGVRASRWIIGNTRAEPTTEFVAEKTTADVQPFEESRLVVAHNGTIANDVQLLEQLGLPLEAAAGTSKIDTSRWLRALASQDHATPDSVLKLLGRTVGSYGIAVANKDAGWLVLATNYKPIWTRQRTTQAGSWLEWTSVAPRSTSMSYLQQLLEGWVMLTPYSAIVVTAGVESASEGAIEYINLREHSAFRSTYAPPVEPRALVVCSGGLDSVTVAAMVAQTMPVDLLHITYGARAEAREVEAVKAVAESEGYGLRFIDLTPVFAAIGNSRLTGTWEGSAAGVEGAEYALEWVPARNTILLAAATGIAEGHGYSYLVLGNNLEESGAYPDNEQEFIGRFNDLLPFAVADGKKVQILEPVGGFTKREIVEAALDLGAPIDRTWSCYDGGERHCGDCGPCFMRRTAFDMLGADDPISYEADEPAA